MAIEQGYATPEKMIKNQEAYIEKRKAEGVVERIGNIIKQFGLGNMKHGSYDRYTPFKNFPDADFLVTAIGSPVGLVQASCNPFKEERSLKGVNLGEIKDQVLEKFKPELEKINLPYSLIKKIAERKAKEGSVGFTPKDMEAIYGGTESYKTDEKNRTTVNGYDFLKANSGGHKCITNITGINFLYSGYDKPYTKDLPQETLPIANYEGKNNFVNDIRSKLLRFRKLSEKQIEMALNQIKKEGGDKKVENQRTTNDLVKDIQDEIVRVLNDKIQSQQGLKESVNKKEDVFGLLKKHINKEKTLSESEWNHVINKLDCVISDRGQWDHPGKCTVIESGNITMQNVDFPLVGIDNTGHMKLMIPQKDYNFPGNKVLEIPLKGKYKNIGLQLLKF
jgi:hypothetical protein